MTGTIPTGIIPDSKCPTCGGKLIVINKKQNSSRTLYGTPTQFVGCANYTDKGCNYVTSITPEIAEAMINLALVQAQELENQTW